MTSSRELKNKIGAVRNIRQITKAMQMVAATKMRKAQESALNARPYAKKSLSLLNNLLQYSQAEGVSGKYWKAGATGVVALVVVTSDKGLAGSFNSAVLRMAAKWREEQESAQGGAKKVEIVAVGKKGRDFFKTRGGEIAAEFFQFSDIVKLGDVTPLMDWLEEAWQQGNYEKIIFCSTQFVSALVQKPEISQLLPLQREELEKTIESIVPKTGKYAEIESSHFAEASRDKNETISFILEPSAKDILEQLVRDLVRVTIVHLIFESNASEHSARMVAMKNATENAEDLIEELNLKLNKSRQAAITQELTEIATAKEALTSE